MKIRDRQSDITKIELEIFNEINKLKKSKYRNVFELMDDYYSEYLKQVEKLYIDKKINIKKELTNNYIFHMIAYLFSYPIFRIIWYITV